MKINAKQIAAKTGLSVAVVKETTSTFDEAERADLVVALSQGKGRGRGDHSFASPKGGLYLGFNLPYTDAPVTAITGLTLCRTLNDFGFDCTIKWLNDIFSNGKKVCGILAVTRVTEERGRRILLGVGINYCTKAALLPPVAGSLSGDKRRASELIASFTSRLTDALKGEFDKVAYETRCFSLGKKVRLHSDDSVGTAVGIDENAALKVRLDNGETVTVNSGEVKFL